MIKYILRKPLFPILLLILMIFDVLFMGIIRRGIEQDIKTVEDMYDNTVVTMEILPGMDSSGTLCLRPHYSVYFEELEECEKIFRTMACPYSLREPEKIMDASWFYGTNDAVWFAGSQGLTISWGQGYEPVDGVVADWLENDGDIPCIVDAELLKQYGLKCGDHCVAAPYDGTGEDSDKAPSVSLYIIGTYENETEILERNSIIVPEVIFLEAPSIMYNWRMLDSYCAYRQYKMQIKSEYNRNIDEIEEKLAETLTRAKVMMHSDVRVLKKAIRPIEQRLKIQKALEGPLEIALSIATALMAVLMAIGVQDDIFLYLLQGESRFVTFIKMMLSLFAIILCISLIAGGMGFIVLGPSWIVWICKYLGYNILLCTVGVMIPVVIFCIKNLVYFYQTKEG